MALGLLRRCSLVPLTLGLALVQGCLSTTSDDEVGCTKDTECAEGRICESRRCVPDPMLGSGGSGGSSGAGGSGGSATGGTGGTGPACSATDPILCPSPDEMSICIQGGYQTIDCVTACTTLGFEVGPCEEALGCACGLPTNAACETGVNAFCECVEGTDTPCARNAPGADPLDLYIRCHTNEPVADATYLVCLGEQVDPEGTIDCQAADEVCS
jgi:hypothetical protein